MILICDLLFADMHFHLGFLHLSAVNSWTSVNFTHLMVKIFQKCVIWLIVIKQNCVETDSAKTLTCKPEHLSSVTTSELDRVLGHQQRQSHGPTLFG